MRPALLLLLLLALPLGACQVRLNNGPLDDDDATGGDDDDAADDDDDLGPCESGDCELTVVEAEAGCDLLPEPDPMPPDGVLVSSPAPGQIRVLHFDHSEGCCPEISVSAVGSLDDRFIAVEVDLSKDFCDCICVLDVTYLLGDVPAGTWTVWGQEIEVE